jgi:DcaP outer membrane protein
MKSTTKPVIALPVRRKNREPMWLYRSNIWTRAVRAILPVIALSVLCLRPAPAQSGDTKKPDLEQLQKRLEQLEQEVRDLKSQLSAAEQAQKPPAAPTTTAPPAVAVAPAAAPKPTEAAQKPAAGGTTLDIYGFAMLDSGYDFKTTNPDWYDVVRPTKLPEYKGEFAPSGNVYASVRQTRFGVKSSTPTKYGDLKTIFEFELFGTGVDAGQTTFRLRHAYGELGQFGAGQTWSPFMDIDVFPNSLEYWGPTGMVFFRNVQVRWMPLKGDSRITIALERPGASADQGIYQDRIELQGVRPRFNLPDLSWQARLGRKWGYVQAAGIFRKIGWEDIDNIAPNLSGSAFGWGLNFTSNLYFTKNNTGRFAVVYGEGIQNYMNDAPVDIGIQKNFGSAEKPIIGVPLPLFSMVAFLDHNWNERFSSAIGYSMLDIQNSDAQTPAAFHQGHYALGNLLYHPVNKVTIGGEFQFGRRVNFSDGFNVNDYRMQFSFRYDWAKGFAF